VISSYQELGKECNLFVKILGEILQGAFGPYPQGADESITKDPAA
jgi:hypothetical protein